VRGRRQESERQSREALQASIEALRFDQRPWPAVSVVGVSGDWVWNENEKRYNITVDFELKSTGKSPAENVSLEARLVPFGPDFITTQSALCNGIRSPHGFTIFPGDVRRLPYRLSLPQPDIERVGSEWKVDSGRGTAFLKAVAASTTLLVSAVYSKQDSTTWLG